MSKQKKKAANIESTQDYSNFIETYASNLYKTLDKLYKNQYYNPIYANGLMKDINMSPHKPTKDQLKRWLENPQKNEKALRDLSQYLSNCIMQYERTVYHFSTLPSFNYMLYPITKVPKDEKELKNYKKSKDKALSWLQKFRLKEQGNYIMTKIIRDGGFYGYVRESPNYIDLQEMPADFSLIDGRTSVGYTFSFNMSFFLRVPESLQGYAPEFVEWYQDFYEDYRKSGNMTYYKRMPIEKSVIFKFDDTNVGMTSPLQGLFKDALNIELYKDLMLQKTQLDTWELIFQEIPKDADGKPTIDPTMAGQFIAMVQSTLPSGVVTVSSPMKPTPMKFSESQSFNNIAGVGQSNYYNSAGVSSYMFGGDNASVSSIIYSNKADANFICTNIYPQVQRFVNYQLSLVTGKYKFGIKLFGDKFNEQEYVERYYQSATVGIGKKLYVASLGIEPFEFENMIDDEDIEGYNEKLIPLSTSFTQSGEDGRPQKDVKDLTNDSSVATKDNGYNDNKIIVK